MEECSGYCDNCQLLLIEQYFKNHQKNSKKGNDDGKLVLSNQNFKKSLKKGNDDDKLILSNQNFKKSLKKGNDEQPSNKFNDRVAIKKSGNLSLSDNRQLNKSDISNVLKKRNVNEQTIQHSKNNLTLSDKYLKKKKGVDVNDKN